MSNRLSIIRDGSNSEQWRYVPTAVNPADHTSRGLHASELTSKEEWLNGPEFLQQPEEMWPSANMNPSKDNETNDGCEDHEGIEVHSHTVKVDENPVDILLSHYSDWTRLKRAVAWWLRTKEEVEKQNKGSSDGKKSNRT